MNFLALFLIIFLIAIVFKTYKSWPSVTAIIIFLLSLTSAALAYGLHRYSLDPTWSLVGQGITKSVYLHFMLVWYAFDIICAVKIIRTHLEYRKINNL